MIEDEPHVRQGLRLRLDTEADLEVVGTAGDAERGLELARELLPDLVLLDGRLPGPSGIGATAGLTDELPDIEIVVLSLFDDAASRDAALAAGAKRFVSKHDGDAALLVALRAPRSSTDGGIVQTDATLVEETPVPEG